MVRDDWIKYYSGSVPGIDIELVDVEVDGQLKLRFQKFRKNIWMSFLGFADKGYMMLTCSFTSI